MQITWDHKFEGFIDIGAIHGAGLKETHVVGFCILLSMLDYDSYRGTFHGAVLFEIGLVADHEAYDILATEIFEFLDPLLKIFKGSWSSDIIHQKGAIGTTVVCTCHGTIPLLTSSVPDLDFDGFVVDYDGFCGELDSNGCFGFKVELVFSEAADYVGFADTGVANEDNFVVEVGGVGFFGHLMEDNKGE